MKIEKKIQLLYAEAIDSKNFFDNEFKKFEFLLVFYGRDESNSLIKVIYPHFKPYFFIPLNNSSEHSVHPFETWTNFAGEKVVKIDFSTQQSWREASKNYSRTYESDIQPVERCLMDSQIFGAMEISGELISQNEKETVVLADQLKPVLLESEFSLFSFDIETSKKNEVISLAYVYEFKQKRTEKVYLLKDKNLANHQQYQNSETVSGFTWVSSEKELIEKFIHDLSILDPDFVLGWNVVGFDLNFLHKKCEKLNIKFKIGRTNKELRLFEGLKGELRAKLFGRVILDGPRILKMNFYNYESYKLNNVAKIVLGESKDIDEDDVDDKWGEIERRYREDPKQLAIYNLKDAILVLDIFKKLSLIELMKKRVQISGLLFDRIGGSTAAFDHYYLPYIHELKLVAPNVIDIEGNLGAQGGFVLEPVVGVHENVVVLDFKSLYPTVISTFKIDPVSRLKRHLTPKTTPVGIQFSSTEYFLPKLIDHLLEARANAKILKDANLSQSIKILMNSFYGVMGSFGCRFYHEELPSAITGSGQWVLKTTIQYIEDKNLKVLYGDTDSIFVQVPELNKDEIKKLVEEINNFLTKKIQDDFLQESKLEIQFDKMFKRLFLSPVRGGVSGAKKKYAGLLWDEKNQTDSLLITGMEFVRSDWSKIARRFQFELLDLFLRQKDLEEYIKTFVADLKAGKFHHELAMKKRLSKDTEEYLKMTPPHVVAAKMLEKERGIKVFQVEFVMTKRGAVPIQLPHEDVDYEYYLEKQLKPLADSVLVFLGKKFDDFIQGEQLSLF